MSADVHLTAAMNELRAETGESLVNSIMAPNRKISQRGLVAHVEASEWEHLLQRGCGS